VLKKEDIKRTEGAKKRSFTALLVICSLTSIIATPSYAQAQSKIETPASKTTPTDGLALNLPSEPSEFPALSGNFLNLPVESVGSTLFKLNIADPNCLTGETNCLSRNEALDLGFSKSITSFSPKGLDLSLTPRAALRFNDESSSAIVGAVVEIGEDLRKGSNFENNTWYFFAGADAEALTYSPNSVSRLNRGQFHLQDRIIVGDAQAGVGYRIGEADVSLSYMRREASSEDFSFTEDAAALSFTWKR